jgi:hypothetical protein
MEKTRIARLVDSYRANNNFVENTFQWLKEFTCSFYVKVEDHGEQAVLIVDGERHFYVTLEAWDTIVRTGGRLLENG